jgi:hypothetical protein
MQKLKNEAPKKTWLGKVEPRVYVIGSSIAAGAGTAGRTNTSWVLD